MAYTFRRITRSPGYTVDDLRRVTGPTLILTGAGDQLCTVEEGVAAFRALPRGEFAVLANYGHVISR